MITGAGTPELRWLPHLDALGLPALEGQPPARALVVAPHPDDEILACGGLLHQLAARGTAVEVLAVSDGEASNPGGSLAPEELAATRRAESEAALALLAPAASLHRLGLPDGGAGALEQPVRSWLDGRLRADDWLLAPWSRDGHPDHDAAGRAAEAAAQGAGARLLAFPVWTWHWADPATDLPWGRAVQVVLPDSVQAAKAAAIRAFATQTVGTGPLPADAPVLPPAVLARFARPFEVLFA